MMNLTFERVTPEHPDARVLVDELSATLAQITGSSGKESFSASDMADDRSVFLLARHGHTPVGCGALRKVDEATCELKRMYVVEKRRGLGSTLLRELENEARRLGYSSIVLETRRVNLRAVNFYLKRGYAVIPNYGRYVGNAAAICFAKCVARPPRVSQ
jgi:GNAT superfamily N-acetyltransferase